MSRTLTAGTIAKMLLSLSDSRGVDITKARAKEYVNRLFPTISSAELLRRTKAVYTVATQLKENGWLESDEAKSLRHFDATMSKAAVEGREIPVKD